MAPLTYLSGVLLLAAAASAAYPRSVARVLTVSNGMPWGGWGTQQFCPTGTWATGFRLKVENPCGKCDDTALNGIELKCSHPTSAGHYGSVTSSTGQWGGWTAMRDCLSLPGNRFFLTQFRLDVEGRQGDGDDTAANNLNFNCRLLNSNQKYELQGNSPAPWGGSKAWSAECPVGTAICGIQTKIEAPVGRGDDTALNDVKLYCCHSR